MSFRSRELVLEDLEGTYATLKEKSNELLLEELKTLINELGELNRWRSENDAAKRRAHMKRLHTTWTTRYQALLDVQKRKEREMTKKDPTIEFTGENAQAFWSHFEASVVRNDAMRVEQKMLHLITRVAKHPHAAKLVSSYKSDGSQFDSCIEAFQEHYISTRKIQADLLKDAKQLGSLKTFDSPIETEIFISQVRSITTRMKMRSGSDNNEYHLIMREIMVKLSETWRNCFYEFYFREPNKSKTSRSKENPIRVMESLVRFLEEKEGIANLKGFIEGNTTEDKRGDKRGVHLNQSDVKENNKRSRPDSARVLAMMGSGICVICEKTDHATGDCEAFDADERFRRLKEANVCVKCTLHSFDPKVGCTNTGTCTKCNNPRGNHHKVICRAKKAFNAVTLTQNPKRQVCLSTLKAKVTWGNRSQVAQVLFDEAAETSLISADMIDKLNARTVPGDPLLLSGVTDGYKRIRETLSFQITALDDSFESQLWAYVSPKITSERIRAPSANIIEIARKKGVEFHSANADAGHVDVLIGQDLLFPFLCIPGEIVPLGPLIGAFRSKLGWHIAGNEYDPNNQAEATSSEISTQMSCHVCQDLNVIFDIPELDDIEDERSWKAFEESIVYDTVNQNYTVRLPLRSIERLGDNYFNASQQVESLRRKLMKNGEFVVYDEAIMSYPRMNYAERVADPIVKQGMYFIPHHGVKKSDSNKTRLRVVFNASSAVKGKRSLNQCLSKGISINANIWTVTLKFRLAPIILMTDLVKAFSQIRIHPDDRDLLRYLWFDTPHASIPTMYRMASVIFGANCSPYLLGAVIKNHGERFQLEYPELVKQLDDGLYMDDGALAAKNTEEARQLMDQAEAFFAKASFQLHPWLSSDPDLVDGTHEFGDLSAVHKCLGLQWQPQSDLINIAPIEPIDNPNPTRREAVSILSKFYDPLNWFAPMKTRIRILIRDMASLSKEWDRSVLPEEKARLDIILSEIREITNLKLPRTLKFEGTICLQGFSDASPQSIGASIYLVGPNPGERLLICAKVKLAPKKILKFNQNITKTSEEGVDATIPRLELAAAAMLARLCDEVLSRIPEGTPVALHSDSEITIRRINSDPDSYDPFERRRLNSILELSTPEHWHHIRSKENPADLLTKDFPVKAWLHSELWWKGPAKDLYGLAKVMPPQRRSCFITCATPTNPEEQAILALRYEEAHQRVASEWQNRLNQEPDLMERFNEGKGRPLSIEGYAKTQLWKLVQREIFSEDISRLRSNLPVSSRSRIKLLQPFLDEWGVLRSTRLSQLTELDWEANHPILLRSHPIVRSFIRQEHERILHDGMKDFRNRFELYYQLLHARRTIRSVIGSCLRCNYLKGKPFSPPDPVLPAFRVECEDLPFRNIGLDYAGPLKTRNALAIHVLLATCAVTRAIHLEVTTSLDTKHCLNALERLFARRGVPREIHSDNAKTFKSTNRALATMARRIQEISEMKDTEDRFQINWHFQAPRAPWLGGFFERMVQSVKNGLQNTSLRRACDMEEILTIMCQVEAIINSRPLVEATMEGMPALTPAHFLVGKSLTGIPPFPGKACQQSRYDEVLRNYLGFRSYQEAFWNRFKRDYIMQLHRYQANLSPSRDPRENELVLVADEQEFGRNRFDWPLARIRRLMAGPDGVIRTAEIEMKGKTFTRAVQRLIPLESSRARQASPPPEDEISRVEAFESSVIAEQSQLRRTRRL